jgi:hypothetical protein
MDIDERETGHFLHSIARSLLLHCGDRDIMLWPRPSFQASGHEAPPRKVLRETLRHFDVQQVLAPPSWHRSSHSNARLMAIDSVFPVRDSLHGKQPARSRQ